MTDTRTLRDGQDDRRGVGAFLPGPKAKDIVDSTLKDHGKRVLVILLMVLPTILGIVYYTSIATDRYVSESRFLVRTGSRSNIGSGLTSFLQMTGITRAQDDTFAVHDFLDSRASLETLPATIDLRRMYGADRADVLSRFPSVIYGDSAEDLRRFMSWMLNVLYDPNTGITTLRVHAFSGAEAQRLAQALLDQSEEVVNRINERLRDDAVRLANQEVARAEESVRTAQLAVTEFRNREMMLDPGRDSILLIELVGKLSAELAETRAQIAATTSGSPDNPQLPTLNRRARALEAQINTERSRIAQNTGGLADKIAVYERLTLDKEFAGRRLVSAITALESARTEARRQQLYLQRIIEPTLPDWPSEPKRFYNIMTIIAGNLLFVLIGWLLVTGIRAHDFR
jgi:capsular polysaccharide transport system permease protein